MAKGSREIFNLEMKLDFRQKRILAGMDMASTDISKQSFMRLDAATRHGFEVHKKTFVDFSMKEMMGIAGPLHDMAVRRIIGDAYNSYMRQLSLEKKRVIINFEYDIPMESLVFSVTGPTASVPYLGNVTFAPNKFINYTPWEDKKSGTRDSGNRAWLWSNVKRTYLKVHNLKNCLVIDCTDPAEEELREKKDREKREKRAARKKGGLLGF